MTKDNRIRFTFRIPTSMFEALKAEAEKRGVSINALILQILWEWAEEKQSIEGR